MKYLLLVALIITLPLGKAQNHYPKTFRSPVDIPRYLSGNFAELRGFHFHSGLDIKTQGKEGEKIYAIEKGFVSRIKIAPSGYGNALYITHPNGYTSVYGHLQGYNNKISAYINKKQHQQKSFALDLTPQPDELLVYKGEIVALSGNSGSSGGPHLHFEIRDTQTEETINPFLFGLTTPDTKKPMLKAMYIYALNGEVAGKKRYDLIGAKQYKSPIYASGAVYLGVKAYDQLNGASNWNGIYQIKAWVNDELYFHFTTDRFSFEETRYINCLTDYQQYMTDRGWIYRLYRVPGNPLEMIKKATNQGVIQLKENKTYHIKIELKDFSGNTTQGEFDLIGKPLKEAPSPQKTENLLQWNTENYWRNDEVELYFPQHAFYEDLHLQVKKNKNKYQIHTEKIPLHKYYTLRILPSNIPKEHLGKAIIAVQYNYAGRQVKDYFPTTYTQGKLEAQVRDFGLFSVEIDQTPPFIKPQSKKSVYTKKNSLLHFTVKDTQGGIKKYDAYIDGEWAVPIYDKKNHRITIDLLKENISTGIHTLRLIIEDYSNNVSECEIQFNYQ